MKNKVVFLIGFILGGIIFGATGVFAATFFSSDVLYDNNNSHLKNANNQDVTNVQDAIDALYTKATSAGPESYIGATTFTPSTSAQTVYTANKLLNSNITINAIPSSYKNLTTSTTVNSSNLLSGATAYNNLGELVIGNVSTDCVSGNLIWTQNDVNNGLVIAQFKPSYLIIKETNNVIYYNKYLNENYLLRTKYNNNDIYNSDGIDKIQNYGLTEYRVQITNQVKLTYPDNRLNQTIYYMVCK